MAFFGLGNKSPYEQALELHGKTKKDSPEEAAALDKMITNAHTFDQADLCFTKARTPAEEKKARDKMFDLATTARQWDRVAERMKNEDDAKHSQAMEKAIFLRNNGGIFS